MYDMTIQLGTDGAKCLYLQIYEHIRLEIREGKLLAGERLPSTRSLAEHLQVARSTVDYAYDQLLSEGYIEARPCKGYFVCPVEELFRLGESAKGGRTEGATRKAMGSAEKKYAYDFSPHGIDMSGFPFGVWKKITKNTLNDGNSELFSLGDSRGDYDLRCAIGRYLHSSRGVNCTPEQILIGAGNDYLLMLLEKILGHSMYIAMENLTYRRAYRIFQSLGYRIVTVEADRGGMRADALEKEDACAVYVMPSHQFPTGTVMPIGRRNELLRWAAAGGERYIIEDDYDSEFRYRGKPIPSLQSSDKHGKVIYVGTFSKSIAPAIRIGYMVLPEALLERYYRECAFYACTVSRTTQRILNEFIRDGYFERHLNKMRKLYRAKHDLLLECLKDFGGRFEISGEDAGLHLLLTARDGALPEAELIRRAAEADVKVYGLSESLVDESPARATVLLGFGGLCEREIREGTERLKSAWVR